MVLLNNEKILRKTVVGRDESTSFVVGLFSVKQAVEEADARGSIPAQAVNLL